MDFQDFRQWFFAVYGANDCGHLVVCRSWKVPAGTDSGDLCRARSHPRRSMRPGAWLAPDGGGVLRKRNAAPEGSKRHPRVVERYLREHFRIAAFVKVSVALISGSHRCAK